MTMDTFERKGVFPFMRLPQELRQMVYKFALISESTQPDIANSFQRSTYPESYIDYEPISAVTLLCTCKHVYHEANVLLYSHNTFTTFYRPEGQQIWDILDLLAGEKSKQAWSNGWLVTRWTACKDAAAQAVSTIHDPDTSKLPAWLFGDFMPGAISRRAEWDPWALEPGPSYDVNGFYFVGFLRKIGPSNAAKIHNLELTFSSLPNAADILPLFSKILKQHVKGLQQLVIDFDCINDYGSTMEFDERNEYQAHHAIAFFNELRTLVKHLLNLEQIDFFSCADEMREMADAVLEEKYTGVAVDLEKKWATLFEEAAVRLLAIPEIANESCIGYRVEDYIYLPNWQRSSRNDFLG